LSQPHFEGVWGWHSHSRNEDLGVLELDCRGQNTSPWGVLYTVGKVLKRRCRKWPRMSHSDIFSTSYVRKKGRKSNWQFDSQPLKVGNRPDLLVRRWRATYRWKALNEGYNFSSDLIAIEDLHKKLCALKVLGAPIVIISGLPLRSPGTKGHLDVTPWRSTEYILYGGKWWLPPSPGCGESTEYRVTHGLS
jgi:hypothetical protein